MLLSSVILCIKKKNKIELINFKAVFILFYPPIFFSRPLCHYYLSFSHSSWQIFATKSYKQPDIAFKLALLHMYVPICVYTEVRDIIQIRVYAVRIGMIVHSFVLYVHTLYLCKYTI